MLIKILTNWRYFKQNSIKTLELIKRTWPFEICFGLKRWKYRINAARFTNSYKRKQKVKLWISIRIFMQRFLV